MGGATSDTKSDGGGAVFVSNHGGRQLDAAPATIDVLPSIVETVDGRLPIVIDGGIRRGTDVVAALALGASAVAVRRPVPWGLAVGGQAGVADFLETLRAEIRNTMTFYGCDSVPELSNDLVYSGRRRVSLAHSRADAGIPAVIESPGSRERTR